MHRQRSCPVVALPNSNMVKCPSPRRLFVMTAALLSGILLATITHDEDRLQINGTDETAPFKVPGPDSICPADSPTGDGLITFIESSGEECLTPRQACGIESAARANPRMDVRVHTNAVRMGPPGWDHRVMRPGKVRSCAFNRILADLHPNVRFIREDFSRWLEEEDSSFRPHLERMKSSPYWVVQLSDVIRLILLKKHGGFYLDFDNIVFRPIHCLRNSVSYLEEAVHIENGIMVMDSEHPFLTFLLRYLSQVYDPSDRISLGPSSFGKAFQIFCQTTEEPLKAGTYPCQGNSTVNLIHPDAFFPIRHNQNGYFYSSSLDGYDSRPMERAFMTHVYLSSWGTKVFPSSLYARLARQYCPSVWNLAESSLVIPFGF